MGDEDFFSDDDLDNIPDNTLRELEQNALASTQLSRPAGQPSRYGGPKPGNNVLVGAPRPPVKSNLPWRPPQPQARPQTAQAPPSAPPASAPAPPSSDYGLDEEEVLDLDEPSMVIQPASGPQQGPSVTRQPSAAPTTAPFRPKPALDPETAAAFAAADAEFEANPGAAQWRDAPHLAPRASNGLDMSALQARIAELEAEQARLKQAEQAARNAAAVKQGEIAIVRSNQEKQAKEYERRIAVMQKLHADEAAKTKTELEAQRKEKEKMLVDNRFLKHDLEQEAQRPKAVNGTGKAVRTGSGKEKDTPRKARKAGLGDGFDDVDVRPVSPSRSREKAKGDTPKHGAKRKRMAHDSPVAALSFTQPPEAVSRQPSMEQPAASAEPPRIVAPAVDTRFHFMQRLLNHRPYEGHERTVEALAKHTIPSQSGTLCSALMDQLSYSLGQDQDDYLPLKLCRVVLKLWAQCVDAQHYAPLYLLLDLINLALCFELASVRSQLIEEAVPLCTRAVFLIADQTRKVSTNPTFAATLDKAAHEKLADELCADEVMDLLVMLCDAASVCPGRLEVYWRHMDLMFVLLMLSKAQPISQINAMLKILATSALPTSFGPVSDDPKAQEVTERGLVDRLTSLISEMPEVPPNEPEYTELEIAEMRLSILSVIKALCQTDHGGLLLAQNKAAIGRLIRFLDGQINRLYGLPPPPPSPTDMQDGAEVTAHGLVAQTINTTMRLLYHLLRTHDDIIDLTAKLNVIHGGHQKFLVALSRVAFSEQLVLERGIEDEVTEAAHSILDSYLSPEEGEAIVAAVETPRGSKGSWGESERDASRGATTEKDTSREETQVDGAGDTTMSDPD